MTKDELKVIERVKDILALGNSIYTKHQIHFEDLKIRFTLYGKAAGKASYIKRTLWFHPQLMKRNIDEYINQTVGHEIAHLYQYKMYPNSKPHGVEFKAIACRLGDNGERCHSLDTSGIGRKKTRYVYECPHGCFEFLLTPYKHKRQQSCKHYYCKRCKQFVTYTGKIKTFI